MDRRQFLAATGTTALSGVGVEFLSSRQNQPSTAFEPLGTVAIDGIKEAVVGADTDTVYAAVSDGFATLDVSDPATPSILAQRRGLLADRDTGPLTQVFDAKVDGDRLLVVGPAEPGANRLQAAVFYDVSDPANPVQVGVYETDYPIHNCYFEDGIAYLTRNERSRNELVVVSGGSDPAQVGSWSIMDRDQRWADVRFPLRVIHDVFVQDGTAYIAHWDAGTWIVDVSDPTAPSLLSRVRGASVETLTSRGRAGAFEPPGNDHYVTVTPDASVLGIGIESWDRPDSGGCGGPSGIELWDISTPTSPTHLATVQPPPSADPTYNGEWTTAHNFELTEDRLYSAWYQGGVRVYDTSDPAAPRPIAGWRDSETTSFWTAQYAGDTVVASSGVNRQAGLTLPDRLYTFPVPDDDAETVTLPTATPCDFDTTTANTTTGDTTKTPRPGSAATPTGSPPDSTTTSTSGSGFGVLATLAGVGLYSRTSQ